MGALAADTSNGAWFEGVLPKRRHAEISEDRVDSNDRQPFCKRLAGQHAVERIPVRAGKAGGRDSVLCISFMTQKPIFPS
jgi:hypothetical protein